jgi:hypothetical protein
MAIKGSLREAGLADVCQLLSMGRRPGACRSPTGPGSARSIFDRGRITFATIVNRRDRLGDLLVREGRSPTSSSGRPWTRRRPQPDRAWARSCWSGAHRRRHAHPAIERQIEEAIYYLFTWKQGNFYFEPGKTPDRGRDPDPGEPGEPPARGARRVDEWSVIEKKIPSMDLIFDLDRERGARRVELTAEQQRLVPLMDGGARWRSWPRRPASASSPRARRSTGWSRPGSPRAWPAGEPEPARPPTWTRRATWASRSTSTGHARGRRAGVPTRPPERPARRHRPPLPGPDRPPAAANRAERSAAHGAARERGPRVGVFLNLALRAPAPAPVRTRPGPRARPASRLPTTPDPPGAKAPRTCSPGTRTRPADQLREYRGMLEPGRVSRRPPTTTAPPWPRPSRPGSIEAEALLEEGLAPTPPPHPSTSWPGTWPSGGPTWRRRRRRISRPPKRTPPGPGAPQPRRPGPSPRRGHEALEHYRGPPRRGPDLGDELYTAWPRSTTEERAGGGRPVLAARAGARIPSNEVARSHLEVVARASG